MNFTQLFIACVICQFYNVVTKPQEKFKNKFYMNLPNREMVNSEKINLLFDSEKKNFENKEKHV